MQNCNNSRLGALTGIAEGCLDQLFSTCFTRQELAENLITNDLHAKANEAITIIANYPSSPPLFTLLHHLEGSPFHLGGGGYRVGSYKRTGPGSCIET